MYYFYAIHSSQNCLKATKKLNEDARNNTFIVIRDPDDDNCLLLLVRYEYVKFKRR